MRLRPATLADIEQISLIEQAAYTHPWPVEAFRDCLRVGYCCWVLIQEAQTAQDKIDAYGIMSVAVQEAHLLNLCVRQECQGQGLGYRLLTHLLQVARSHEAEYIYLEVRQSNHQALKLYQSLGFTRIGMRKAYYAAKQGREDAIVFCYDLRHYEPWSAVESGGRYQTDSINKAY